MSTITRSALRNAIEVGIENSDLPAEAIKRLRAFGHTAQAVIIGSYGSEKCGCPLVGGRVLSSRGLVPLVDGMTQDNERAFYRAFDRHASKAMDTTFNGDATFIGTRVFG